MKKIVLYLFCILLGFFVIVMDHFIRPTVNGWVGVILLCFSFIMIVLSFIKLLNKMKLIRLHRRMIEVVFFAFLLWFGALSIDFKRHCLMYEPIFSHLGYEVKVDYDMDLETGSVYEQTSTFYLFGIKMHVSGWIVSLKENQNEA